MRDEFEKLAASGKIKPHQVAPLVELTAQRFCVHKSWGFGRISQVDLVFARFTVDFQGKAGHAMDLAFAADSLKAIAADHILARKLSDIDSLRRLAAQNHLDLVKLVLNSYEGKATPDQIMQALVPDVIRDDWKKWWEAAKREMKKDGHFTLSSKKTDPITYTAGETTLGIRILADFKAAKGLKVRVAVVTEALKSFDDVDGKTELATEIIAALNADITSHQRTQPAIALEAIFVRDELAKAAGLQPAEGELSATALWQQDTIRVASLLEDITAAKQRKALQSFKESTPVWFEALLGILNNVSTKLAGEIAYTLIAHDRGNELKNDIARLIAQHSASSDLLLWLAKERSDSYADILNAEVFRAMLTAIERDQFMEKRSNKLRDYILSDQELVVDLIGCSDLVVIKDLTLSLQLSPVFDDMDKRSLLGRIVKAYPAIQSLISGEQTRQDNSIIVPWASLERRKAEYTTLVQKAIPANREEIAIARSYGDLRENHEYKAAKEQQRVLMRRKAELEIDLARAKGSDFANVKTDAVGIGTKVQVTDTATNTPETYSLLGAWDGDPDKHLISYLTPMGQALMNHKVGDVAVFDMGGAKRNLRIDSIAVA